MQIQPGQTVLLTGASGGLGNYIAEALVEKRVQLALVAYPGVGLEALHQKVQKLGCKSIWIAADLRDSGERKRSLAKVRSELGEVDILINNAGVESTSAYDDLSEETICQMIAVNLEAPMVLSHMVLPGMLERKRGHIVNISSLAGRAGPAYQEPYAATKAGLIAFTYSFRATYRDTGVSASVITPGFVEAGIYSDLKAQTGFSAPAVLGTSKPQTVQRAVIRAIEKNLPEVIINALPIKPLLLVNLLVPSLGEWLTHKTGANQFFGKVAKALKEKRQSAVQPNGARQDINH
jgi:short-subunit dehydrogenase